MLRPRTPGVTTLLTPTGSRRPMQDRLVPAVPCSCATGDTRPVPDAVRNETERPKTSTLGQPQIDSGRARAGRGRREEEKGDGADGKAPKDRPSGRGGGARHGEGRGGAVLFPAEKSVQRPRSRGAAPRRRSAASNYE